jgi:hypothetical protein
MPQFYCFYILFTIFLTNQEKKEEEDNKMRHDDKKTSGTRGLDTQEENHTIGLSLHGGGAGTGLVGAGIMRGFQQKKVLVNDMEVPAMDKFKYTSALSGGNLASIMYAYAKGVTSDELLDVDGIIDPYEMTLEELEYIPEKTIFSVLSDGIEERFALAFITASILKTPIVPTVVQFCFLDPLGISAFDAVDGPRRIDAKPTPIAEVSMVGPAELWPEYFCGKILKRFIETYNSVMKDHNTSLPLSPSNSNTLMWDIAQTSDFQIPVFGYITPDEFNVPMSEHEMKFGNNTDPIDFKPVSEKPDDVLPTLGTGSFTVAKMLGASVNFLNILACAGDDQALQDLSQQEKINIPTGDDGDSRDMFITDGGFNDGSGIPALVQKKVRKIVSVISMYEIPRDRHPLDSLEIQTWGQLKHYFGFTPTELDDEMLPSAVVHIFDNSGNQYEKMMDNLNALFDAGKPMITTLKDLDVIENRFFGIEGGYKVDLTVIVVYGVPTAFSNAIPNDIAPPPNGMNFTNEYGFFNNPDLQNVPNNPMTGDPMVLDIPELGINKDTGIPYFGVKPKAAKMTYVLCSWMIHYSWNGLWDAEGEKRFDGFAEIFE